jgi:RES domain-containing protein
MAARQASHDVRLLDALAAMPTSRFDGACWRVVQNGRSPLDGSKGAGRWNLRRSEVLYCALEADGALSEIHYHYSRGQSVFPSRLQSALHRLDVRFANVLDLSDIETLIGLGVDRSRYREMLYERTQQIGEAVGFLGFEAMLVPNARHDSVNLVAFLDNCDLDTIQAGDGSAVDWRAWQASVSKR